MRRTYHVYRGFDRTTAAHMGRFNSLQDAIHSARKLATYLGPVTTVRDTLGGLHAECHRQPDGSINIVWAS
jgi:hypothetical protein